MEHFQTEVLDAAADLDEHFSELKSVARGRLGDLFDEADYPPSLVGLFHLNWDFPSVEPPEYLQRLSPQLYAEECQRMQGRFDEAIRLAEQAFLKELSKLVDHLTERLSGIADGKPKVFRDSAVSNLNEFFERFQYWNVRSNEQLDELVARAQQVVQGIQPQQLRDNQGTRQRVASQLSGVQSVLNGLLIDRPRPFELLPDCEGNNEEPVTIECSDDDRVLACWHDNGIPRVRQYDVPTKDEHDFPARPNRMSTNVPGLLSALRDSMDSVDTKSLRNAINCIQADGALGRLAATDSRQLFLQDGFDFPWNDAVLIPGDKVFASPWLPHDEPVEIGKTDDWATVCCGPWTIHLRLQAEGRFPNVDSVNLAAKSIRFTDHAGVEFEFEFHAIANRQRIDLPSLLQNRFQVNRPDDLSLRDASHVIDELKSQPASNG